MTLRLIALILSTALSISAFSQDVQSEFNAKLKETSTRNKTIQCDFVQNKKVKNIAKTASSSGAFYCDNAGRMAMHYTKPQGDKMVMSGESFTLITSGKRVSSDARSTPMMAQISYMMQACMSGDVSKLGSGWKMTIDKIAHGYSVQLKPNDRRIARYITSMTMHFAAENLTLDLLRIDEASGGYTEYAFTNKVINKEINDSLFNVE